MRVCRHDRVWMCGRPGSKRAWRFDLFRMGVLGERVGTARNTQTGHTPVSPGDNYGSRSKRSSPLAKKTVLRLGTKKKA